MADAEEKPEGELTPAELKKREANRKKREKAKAKAKAEKEGAGAGAGAAGDPATFCAHCGKAADKLKCPKCVAMGLKDTYYCNQDCFKAAWGTHKEVRFCRFLSLQACIAPPPHRAAVASRVL
jgi:hypothetical protein